MSIETTVHYVVHYRYPWDYDDDSPSGIGDHTLQWDDSSKAIEATTDDEARLASLAEEFRRPRNSFVDVYKRQLTWERCTCSPGRTHRVAMVGSA